jgi:hypothetical protein
VVLTGRAYLLAVAMAAIGISTPVSAEIARTTDNSFVVRHEVVVEANPTKAWLALISPAGWWRKEHTWSGDAQNLTLTPQGGGCFCETIPAVDEPGRFTLQGSVEHMRVLQAYPESALRMQGALGPLQSEPVTGILTIAISKTGQGTRIVWEYHVGGPMRYEVPVIAKAVDGVMGQQVAALGKLLGVVAVPEPVEPEAAPAEAEAEAKPDANASEARVPAVAKPKSPTPAPVGAKPASAPTIKPAPTLTAPAAAAPAAKQVNAPSSKAVAPPASTSKIEPKPAAKPEPKAGTVDDAFGDLKDDPPRG